MTTTTELVTIRLPVQAANRLRRVAEIAHRPIDDVVAATLQSTLPPLLDDLPVVLQPLLATLETWSSEALRHQLYATVDDETLDRYDDLLAQNAAGRLTEAEHNELDTLRQQNDLLMFRKAYAALLLKWRGERVPTLTELEAVG
jgi:hypothetical protein